MITELYTTRTVTYHRNSFQIFWRHWIFSKTQTQREREIEIHTFLIIKFQSSTSITTLYCDSIFDNHVHSVQREREIERDRKNVRTIESKREIFKDRERETESERDEYETERGR